jgi:hypothetical protein
MSACLYACAFSKLTDRPTLNRSADRFRSMLRQKPVEFLYAKPFRRPLGKALQAAFGPQFLALRLQRLEV